MGDLTFLWYNYRFAGKPLLLADFHGRLSWPTFMADFYDVWPADVGRQKSASATSPNFYYCEFKCEFLLLSAVQNMPDTKSFVFSEKFWPC